jgi:hypothetical protein
MLFAELYKEIASLETRRIPMSLSAFADKHASLFEKKFDGLPNLRLCGMHDNSRSRHISPSALLAPTVSIEPGKVAVLFGESGSGKTVAMLQAVEKEGPTVAVYATGGKLFEAGDFPDHPEGNRDPSSPDYKKWAIRREEATLQHLVAYFHATLDGSARHTPFVRGDVADPQSLTFIIDEMGGHREYTRALCRDELRPKLADSLGVNKVSIIVGGTGCTFTWDEVASECHTVDPRNMQPRAAEEWASHYGKEIARIETDSTEAGRYAKAMLGNARSAVAMLEMLKAWPMMSILSAVRAAAQRYQSLNGLERVPPEGRLAIIAKALSLVMSKSRVDLEHRSSHPFWQGLDKGAVDSAHCEMDLVRKLGVLTDSTVCLGEKQQPRVDLTKPRYLVTEAQTVMFLLQYGLQLTHTSSGSGFELSVKDYFVSLFTACRFLKPATHADLLQHAFPANAPQPSSTGDGEPIDWDSLSGVKVLEAREKVDAKMKGLKVAQRRAKEEAKEEAKKEAAKKKEEAKEEEAAAEVEEDQDEQDGDAVPDGRPLSDVDTIKEAMENNWIVIVVNSAEAQFADIMIFFPNGIWWAIQVKRYANTPLLEWQAYNELSKMGAPDSLSRNGNLVDSIGGTIVKKFNPPPDAALGGAATKPKIWSWLEANPEFALPDDNESKAAFAKAAQRSDSRHQFVLELGEEIYGTTQCEPIRAFVVGGRGTGDAPLIEVPSTVCLRTVDLDAKVSSLYPIRPALRNASGGALVADFSFQPDAL